MTAINFCKLKFFTIILRTAHPVLLRKIPHTAAATTTANPTPPLINHRIAFFLPLHYPPQLGALREVAERGGPRRPDRAVGRH